METQSGADSEAELLVASLKSLVESYKTALEKSTADYRQKTDLNNFLAYYNDYSHGILKLGAPIYVYADCMKSVGVKTWAEFEQVCAKYEQNSEVKDALSKFREQEANYNKFLAEIEEDLSQLEANVNTKPLAKPGQLLPKNQLIEIPSGQPVTLETCCKASKHTLFILLRLFG